MKKKTQLTRNLCTFIAKTRMNLFSCFCVYLDFRKFGIIFFVLCFRSFAAFYSLDVSSNVTIPSSLFFPHFIYSTLFLASPTFLYSFFFFSEWTKKCIQIYIWWFRWRQRRWINVLLASLFHSFHFHIFFLSLLHLFVVWSRNIFFFRISRMHNVCTKYSQTCTRKKFKSIQFYFPWMFDHQEWWNWRWCFFLDFIIIICCLRWWWWWSWCSMIKCVLKP